MDLHATMPHVYAHLGVAPLPPDDSEAYGLRFGPVTVNLRPVPQQPACVLQSQLGPIDLEDTALLQSLLADNLLPARATASVLGLDLYGCVQLTERVDLARTDAHRVLACLTPFVARARGWQQRLKRARA